MKISIIGSGHVGLVTGACLASMGHDVLCVDSDGKKIADLKGGRMPFHEPGLEEMVQGLAKAGRLAFSTSNAEAVLHGKAVFISVWTPPLPSGRADLSFVEKVSRDIAENLPSNEYRLIVEKSTVPVNTGERVIATLERFAPSGRDWEVASNPEFLREGSAIKDTLEPDRIVIGVPSGRAREVLEEIYRDFPGERVVCDVKSAEMIKHASNSFLAMKISFINAVARVCEKSGADVELVARGMGLDPRIAPGFLKAGVGYGGSCFPKDVDAFIDIARQLGYEFRLLEEVQRVNEHARVHFVDLLEKELWNLRNKPIAVLGLSFKPDTDDMRRAPSITIIGEILERGGTVRAFDPVALPAARKEMGGLMERYGKNLKSPRRRLVSNGDGFGGPSENSESKEGEGAKLIFCESAEEACRGAEAVLLLTEWPQIVKADWASLSAIVSTPVVLDGRGALDRSALEKAGWTVRGVGRSSG